MTPSVPTEPLRPGPSFPERAIKTVGEAAASLRASQPPSGDLLDTLKAEEEKVFRKHWPQGKPTGDGNSYFDKVMAIRVNRLKWKSRVETAGEIVWLSGKLASVALCLGVAWQYIPH